MGLKPRTSTLIEKILREQDLQRRVQMTARFFALELHPRDVGPKHEDVVEKCLQDSLQTGDYDQALKCLERQQRSFSARRELRFMDLAVTIFLRNNRKRDALKWVVGVADISGSGAVMHIRTAVEFNALHTSKRFQRIFEPNAELSRLRTDLKESISAWKNDDYDNFKDAISDSRGLLREAQRLDKGLVGKAQKHLNEILKEARQLIEDDPIARDYLNGLV